MGRKKKYDSRLFCVTIFLVALGLIMVTSASLIMAQEQFSSPFFFLHRHAVRVALGLLVLLLFSWIPYRVYQRVAIPMLTVSIILLIAIFLWGREVRGANRWLPMFNIVIQPVEIAKFSLLIFMSAKIAQWKERVKDFKSGFVPLMSAPIIIALLLAKQPNISNAIFVILFSFVMLFVGGCRLRHLSAFALSVFAAAVPFLYKMPHIQDRWSTFLNPGADPQGVGWHMEQSLIAFGSGFILGCGPGRGHQKYSFLPDAHTDFIYSIIGEELGALGAIAVLILFFFIFRRAIHIARKSSHPFGYLLAVGIGTMIFTTAMINISMTLGIIPVAGLPLPLISYGGSSLVTSMAAIGILLNISSGGMGKAVTSKRLARSKTSRPLYAKAVR